MSYILRHSNIETDDNGYIDIDILLNHKDLKKYKITFEIIKNIVDNKFIGANQGHSNNKKLK
jgi:RNA:NAD 2'-phosphotransferase (TPT1/KptA family)